MQRINHRDLTDGQRFTVDGGTTWHVTAVALFGTVAVYVTDRRDDQAPTIRIAAHSDGSVEIDD